MIPFMDLKRQVEEIGPEIFSSIQKVIADTAFSGGPYVETFEKEFANYQNIQHVAAVSNGTDALHLAFRALNIGPGDEVLVPTNSFIASAWGPSHAGAIPVFVDCESNTWNISLSDAEKRITPKTKAILAVHLYGAPCDMDAVIAFAQKHRLKVVEDCAQAHGAKWRGKLVGSFGDLSCFSFYPGKNLGAFGEAGAVGSRDSQLIHRVKGLRNHGGHGKYAHDELGFNFRMDGIQAVVLSHKLNHLNAWTERRQAIARRYRTELRGTRVQMQQPPEGSESVYHLFVVSVSNREKFQAHMTAQGVQTGIHYPVPIHQQKAYATGGAPASLPEAEKHCRSCVSLPMFPELTDAEVQRVIQAVRAYG